MGMDFLCGLTRKRAELICARRSSRRYRGPNSERDLALTLMAEWRQETRREMTALHELAALCPASAPAAFQRLDAVASKSPIASAPLTAHRLA
jgi:hypothetical protein